MNITVNGRETRVPDFFVVGAAKSATTSLHSYLTQHPQIFLPERKELYYFAFNGETPRFKLSDGTLRPAVGCSAKEYFAYYSQCPQAAMAGDTSSWYLYYHQNVIANINNLYGPAAGDARVIIVLRNPIDRAWSHYCMHLGQGLINLSYKEAVASPGFRDKLNEGYYPGYDYLGFGLYARQVQAYLAAFDHVKILLYEDFNKDNSTTVNSILSFLGLEPLPVIQKDTRLNVSGAPKSTTAAWISKLLYKPYLFKRIITPLLPAGLRYKLKNRAGQYLFKKKDMTDEDRRMTINFFRDNILQLQDIIKRDLSRWLQ